MPRRRIFVLLAIVCLVALGTIAWLERPRDDPAKATVEDAVRLFRAEDAGGSRGNSDQPAPGVYRYATRGSESAETGLLSATHDYDGVSTITITPGHCGQAERWQVLEERWTEIESCPSPSGDQVRSVTQFHEFFGVEQEDAFRCHGPGKCEAPNSSVASTFRVGGSETVRVAGRPYEAIHTVTQSVLKGETAGTARTEDWRRHSDGLLLRRSVFSDAETGDAIDVHYTERYTIELLDPEPQR